MQQRQAAHLCERIAEHVTEIQAGRVTATFAEGHERRVGSFGLKRVRRDLFEDRQPEQIVQENDRSLPPSAMNHHTRLDH